MSLLMIGGIQVFLPPSLEEANVCVEDEAEIAREGQLAETVRKEELEHVFEAAQAEEENEHSEECLISFSQEVEEAAALKMTVEEAAKEEEPDSIFFAYLYEHIKALERRVKVQGIHIQQVKLETDEEGVGDHSDLPMCRKFLQLGRLQK